MDNFVVGCVFDDDRQLFPFLVCPRTARLPPDVFIHELFSRLSGGKRWPDLSTLCLFHRHQKLKNCVRNSCFLGTFTGRFGDT